jgi:hypothetical protein
MSHTDYAVSFFWDDEPVAKVQPAMAGKRTLIVGDRQRNTSVRFTGTEGQLQALYDAIGAELALTCTGRKVRLPLFEDDEGQEYEILHNEPCPFHKWNPYTDTVGPGERWATPRCGFPSNRGDAVCILTADHDGLHQAADRWCWADPEPVGPPTIDEWPSADDAYHGRDD